MIVTSKDVTEADVQAMLAAGNVKIVEEDRQIIDMGTVVEEEVRVTVTSAHDGQTVTEEKTVTNKEGDGGETKLFEKNRSRSSSSSSSSSSDDEPPAVPVNMCEPVSEDSVPALASMIQAKVNVVEPTAAAEEDENASSSSDSSDDEDAGEHKIELPSPPVQKEEDSSENETKKDNVATMEQGEALLPTPPSPAVARERGERGDNSSSEYWSEKVIAAVLFEEVVHHHPSSSSSDQELEQDEHPAGAAQEEQDIQQVSHDDALVELRPDKMVESNVANKEEEK
jgi:hypothetical protein